MNSYEVGSPGIYPPPVRSWREVLTDKSLLILVALAFFVVISGVSMVAKWTLDRIGISGRDLNFSLLAAICVHSMWRIRNLETTVRELTRKLDKFIDPPMVPTPPGS